MITVIHHSADYDGIFCREIAKKSLPPDTVLIGWDFGDEKIAFPAGEDAVYVMDLPIDRIFVGIPDPGRVIWIDHHKSSIESNKVDYAGYRIDGVAACRLAWQWFNSEFNRASTTVERSAHWNMCMAPHKDAFLNRKVIEPLAVRLTGEFDIWDHRDNQEDITFQYGLDAQAVIPWPRVLSHLDEGFVQGCLLDGKAAQRCIAKRNADVVKAKGFDIYFNGLNFLALNTPHKGSLTMEAGVKPHHDACLAFSWNGREWVVGMYGVDGKRHLDLSTIAVAYGGGGHKQACGFQTRYLPWLPS